MSFVLISDAFGSSKFLVLEADYDSHALVCTCQDMELFFTFGHRRSCSILQRNQEEDLGITKRMKTLLNEQVFNASHDFIKVKHGSCVKDEQEKISVDVNKVLGLVKEDQEEGEDFNIDNHHIQEGSKHRNGIQQVKEKTLHIY